MNVMQCVCTLCVWCGANMCACIVMCVGVVGGSFIMNNQMCVVVGMHMHMSHMCIKHYWCVMVPVYSCDDHVCE